MHCLIPNGDGYSFLNYKENGTIDLIHNGEKIINVRQFLYSPNGESFSYIQSINKKLYVVTDGKIGSFGFDIITNLSYSGNGEKISYAGQNYSEVNKMHIIENDKELFLSNWLVTKLFYNDENDLYVENMSKESFINGKKQDNLYYEIYENSLGKGGLYKYKFFSNKKDLSDIDRYNGKKIIIENGVEYGPFDGLGEFVRNKYGKLAFVGIENGNYYLFYNGEKKGPFKHLYNLKFSDNGNNFAFITCNQNLNNFYKEKKECYIIKDGEKYSKETSAISTKKHQKKVILSKNHFFLSKYTTFS